MQLGDIMKRFMIFSFLALLIGGLFAYFMFDAGISNSVSK